MRELEVIKNAVILETGIDITANVRDHKTITSRWLYFNLARKHTEYSLKQIGKFVGRDHATVLYGLRQFEIECEWDKDLQAKHDRLTIICMQELNCDTIKAVTEQIQFMHSEIARLYEIKKQLMSDEFANAK